MPASVPVNFAINGTTITNQPSGLQELFPEPVIYQTLGGGRVVHQPLAGVVVEAIWGVDAARAEVYGELRNRRPASGSVSISYRGAHGTTFTRTVYMPQVPYDQFLLTSAISQLTMQFYTLPYAP